MNQGVAKQYPKQVRELIGALVETGLDSKEITRRLNDGEAGYDAPLPIKYRRVRELAAEWEAEHGPPRLTEDFDPKADSFARLRHRISARLIEELRYYEEQKAGRLSHDDIAKIQRIHTALFNFEQKAELKESKVRSKSLRSKKTSGKAGKAESAIDQLAREQREASITTGGPPSSTTKPNNATSDGDRAQENASEDGATQGAEPSEGPLRRPTTSHQGILGRQAGHGGRGAERGESGQGRGAV